MGSEIWCKMNTVLADPAKMIAKGAPHVIHNDKELEVYTNALFQLTALEDPSSADRKSTRLNSSHGYISYAVFCLKKKNADQFPSVTLSFAHHAGHSIGDAHVAADPPQLDP